MTPMVLALGEKTVRNQKEQKPHAGLNPLESSRIIVLDESFLHPSLNRTSVAYSVCRKASSATCNRCASCGRSVQISRLHPYAETAPQVQPPQQRCDVGLLVALTRVAPPGDDSHVGSRSAARFPARQWLRQPHLQLHQC